MSGLRRALKRLAVGALLVVALAAAPIVYVETQCRGVVEPESASTKKSEITDPHFLRAVGDSYLSYPEWYIVHAYDDLAGVTRKSSESDFDYLASISGFWRSMCRTTQAAERIGSVSLDQRVTDYIIGDSFSLEMAVIGAWERSLGALSAWARGPQRTPEDEFALKFADDYAAFLRQIPWYRYPFWPKLQQFWSETPFGEVSFVRSLERRVALSLEYGGKAIYAQALGALAGAAPADLRIRSVIEGFERTDLAADARITLIGQTVDGASIIETARYQELTEILQKLAVHGRRVREIAGNRRILTTVLAPEGKALAIGGVEIFSLPIQSQPGRRRVGFDVPVADLAHQMVEAARQGAEFEHAYDY